MQAQEIREQISSLNDELKDTLKEVNARHGERNLLLKQIEEFNNLKKQSEHELENQQALLLRDRDQHMVALKVVTDIRNTRLAETEILISNAKVLEIKEANLNEKIKNLKTDKSKLQIIRQELQEAEKNKPLIEAVKKELLQAIDNLNEAKVELDIVTRKAERTKEQDMKDHQQHIVWLIDTRAKVKSEIEGSVQLRIAWETKLKDLKIVEKRLKKLWDQGTKLPFPKIYCA